ncbi:hypothetical protein DFH94DRAFT_726597 [Russula ochroleuca]|uniref:Uncharacterized protein n=1 Tax=Russula ochroleuca TaxID=152965 RepID=A0A9P5TB24_9AGAM|nr:hypothetical protein DFH94DRAFT_726597 [Russula ochroleuca]
MCLLEMCRASRIYMFLGCTYAFATTNATVYSVRTVLFAGLYLRISTARVGGCTYRWERPLPHWASRGDSTADTSRDEPRQPTCSDVRSHLQYQGPIPIPRYAPRSLGMRMECASVVRTQTRRLRASG